MKSLWSDADAQDCVKRYAEKGVNADLALRTYTTRLLGGDPKLVLHGGGNTSVKTTAKDQLGEDVEVLHIKGSGWDMGSIEPEGLPAVKLAEMRRLRNLSKLSDEDMVNFQRINLFDASAPNPSVETLLHAFLPHKFVDHTHSTAVLALTDQPNLEGLILPRHGIFPFAEDAKTAYEKMIEFVTMAEDRLKQNAKPLKQAELPKHIARVADIAPILRG